MTNKLSEEIDFGNLRGVGNIGFQDVTINVGASGLDRFTTVIEITIGLLSLVSFVYFVLRLVVAGVTMVSSGGDKTKVANARKDMATSLVGIVIVVSAIFIAEFVGYLLGINILNVAGGIVELWNQNT